jgi:hypothetical protein
MQWAKFRQVSDPKKILAQFRIRARQMPTEWQETSPVQVDMTKDGSLHTRLIRDKKSWTIYAHIERSRIVVDSLQEDGVPHISSTQDAKLPEVAPKAPEPIPIAPVFEEECVPDIEEPPPAAAPPVLGYEVVDPRMLLFPAGSRVGDLPGDWALVSPLNQNPSLEGSFRLRFRSQGKSWTAYGHLELGRLAIDHVQEDGKPHFTARKISQGGMPSGS